MLPTINVPPTIEQELARYALYEKCDNYDFLIMQARTLAHGRGATQAEIERNVMALEID